jgi:predicted O-methyltransferase YrrM
LVRLASLTGLVSEPVGEALARLAARVPAEQAIVELGSFKGKSTCYLAAGAKDGLGAKVFAVDPWDTAGNETGRFGFAEHSTREAFDAQVRLMRFLSRITPIQGFAADVAETWTGPPVGLLFIDSDHREQNVAADYRAWAPHLAADATVVFDDYLSPRNPGVKAAVEQLGLTVKLEADWLAVTT